MEKVTVEISSYPKSGNTWVRHLIGAFLSRLGYSGSVPLDLHQNKDRIEQRPWMEIGGRLYSFYKSHVPFDKRMSPDEIIYVYRHPLDVLLSTLNHLALRGHAWAFRGGVIRSVDELHRTGDLDFYFDDFAKNLGAGFWRGMLGDLSNLQRHTEYAQERGVISVRYEDLFASREKAFGEVITHLLGELPIPLEGVFDSADAATKGTGRAFFWKAKAETRKDYFSREQIEFFEGIHSNWLGRLGYIE